MATAHRSARGARRRVVLRVEKRRRERGSVSDGAEMYDYTPNRSDTTTKCSEFCSNEAPCSDRSVWGATPVIKSKSETHINAGIISGDTEDVYPMHSTPATTSVGEHHALDASIVVAQTGGASLSKSVFSEGEKATEREGKREVEAEGRERSENEFGEEEEREQEREEEIGDSHSDDVFLGNSTSEAAITLKSSDGNFKMADSFTDSFSKLKGLGTGSDHLPPLPTSRRRRPYTSPGRNSSSCSTDSYTSPARNHTALAATISGGDSERIMSARRKLQRSGKSARRGRTNRVHPENRPPNLTLSSPLHSSTVQSTLPGATSNTAGSRTLSLTDSISSTLSATMTTPLLTASLRKGGGGSLPSTGSSWDFDARAQLESVFPDRQMRVLVVTWNMQQQKDLPDSLDNLLLPLTQDTAADMFVLGTQESTPSRREWEVLIQQTLGPSYVLVQSSSLGVIYLLLYLRRDLIWFCSAVCTASFATRPVTLIKTKGAVGLSFTLFGSSFLFITSHFTAHDQKVAERNSDMQRISVNLSLAGDSSEKEVLMLDSFDHIFWFGDFNYRVELTRDEADQHLANSDWMSLLLKDQLTREILHGNVFPGFSEQPISFAPSYKFDLHSDVYDSSEKRRVPSWTDRILFKSHERSGINGCEYGCCHSLKCSDHRPVYGIFKVKLEPSKHIESIPDTVVTFDREIYIQAQKQRKMAARLASIKASEETDGLTTADTNRTSGRVTSAMCTII